MPPPQLPAQPGTKEEYIALITEVSKTQEVRVFQKLRELEVPVEKHEAAIWDAVQMIFEAGKRKPMAQWLETEDHRLLALATFFPPVGAVMHEAIDDIVCEAFEIHRPLVHKPPGGDAAGLAANVATAGTQMIVTASEKQEMERTMILAKKIRVPKFNDKPWDAFYPHHWLPLLADKSPEDVFAIWKTRVEQLFARKQIHENTVHRFQHLEDQMELWLRAQTGVEVLSYDTYRGFFHIVEQVAEVYLLTCVTLQSSYKNATLAFNQHVRAKWATHSLIDYHAALRIAADAKEPAAKNPFRGGQR